MALAYTVAVMDEALMGRSFPAITRWNRLEGRPRTHDFDRALKAEVRDSLWMIAKQWQMGEFHGDDAASPVLARVCIDTAPIDRFQAAQGPVEALDVVQPLETRVERRPPPLSAGTQLLSLDLRMTAGRRWLKLLAREAAAGTLSADYRQACIDAYPVPVPAPNVAGDAMVCAHADAWQQTSAAAGRAMDGIAFLERFAAGANDALNRFGAAAGDVAQLTELAGALAAWLGGLIVKPPPAGNDAWLPSRLEYQFGVSAPGPAQENVLRAEEYYQGALDWYALERRPGEAQLGEPPAPPRTADRQVHTFIPVPIVFEGMPNTRWWSFEDRRTNFGEARPDKTDLGKLLLMEFALVYANDWFVVPHTLDVGTTTQVQGIALTNVFGERFWIEPVRELPAAGWERWSMFTPGTATAEPQPPPPQLILLPTVPKVQEGAPLEEVAFLRDEMANMVWAIERRITLPTGFTKPGAEAARELRGFLEKPLREEVEKLQARKAEIEKIAEAVRSPAEVDELAAIDLRLAQILPPEARAPIRYQVMSTVPEQWIPFIPVHRDGSAREIQLQRAALPRLMAGDPNPPEKVRPRTQLLRHRLPQAYFVHEEEVPRAGVVVSQSYQRTRWIGGKVFTWLGARKQTGRGEGSSGLAFDQIKPAK
ncbi:MAG TPA: hypothetical protein VGQ36_25115 [Thermoanaerobaculia bacterium]|jgi:hypothetical protein|nr:hypothetical protein [Thermoanaerobaculia bacterium]